MSNLDINGLRKDEELVVRKRRRNSLAPFTPIAPLPNRSSRLNGPNPFYLLAVVTKTAYKLFLDITYEMDIQTNVCILATKGLTQTEQTIRARYVRELMKNNLVKRIIGDKKRLFPTRLEISTGGVMVNPYLIKPMDNCEQFQKIWDVL